jgi:hypothetical protein
MFIATVDDPKNPPCPGPVIIHADGTIECEGGCEGVRHAYHPPGSMFACDVAGGSTSWGVLVAPLTPRYPAGCPDGCPCPGAERLSPKGNGRRPLTAVSTREGSGCRRGSGVGLRLRAARR